MKSKINLDEGFFFGMGLFETIKVVNKKPILLESHINRINNSLKVFDIHERLEKTEVLDFIEGFEESNYALKISISRENKIFTTRNDEYNINSPEKVKLNLASTLRNSTSIMTYHKTFNYMDNILEKKKSKEKGFFEPIFLNEKGYITEGAVSNIFFVRDNKIYTPKVESGLLNGVMREFFIKEFNVSEIFIKKHEIESFDSGFITNSLMGYIEIEQIGDCILKRLQLKKDFNERLKNIGFIKL
ncbi:MAG: aminotransferase class IV [Lagierella massiliensis]|nr:aminotransferase class IV [Lagierella massiliensis]